MDLERRDAGNGLSAVTDGQHIADRVLLADDLGIEINDVEVGLLQQFKKKALGLVIFFQQTLTFWQDHLAWN